MASPQEITRFLTDLNDRRERLLSLVEPTGPRQEALVSELHELAEQLIVADEELRVQAEELAEANRRLQARAARTGAGDLDSSEATVSTDHRGLVRDTNRAADQLVLRPVIRLQPRPIATWFAVEDRSAVRSLISRLRDGSQSAALDAAVVLRPDGTSVPVAISVRRAGQQWDGEDGFVWTLRPVTADSSAPPVTTRSPLRATDQNELISDLASVATSLAQLNDPTAVLEATVDAALRLIPEADHAAACLSPGAGGTQVGRAGDETADALESAGRHVHQGPTQEVLAHPAPVHVRDLRRESQRWPAVVAIGSGLGVRSTMSVPIPVPLRNPQPAAVTLYAQTVNAFDERSQFIASMLAAHAGVALARAISEEQLRTGLERRQHIGEAVGVLVERHKITTDAAFRQLVEISNTHNIKVRDLAQAIVETGQEPADVPLP